MRTICAALLAAAVVPLASCGGIGPSPSKSVQGTWVARGIGHGLSFTMTLAQSGDTIVGFACGISDGVVLFRSSPVTGDHPDVRFVVTEATVSSCCPHLTGSRFVGKASGATIAGSSDFGSGLEFERTSTAPACDSQYGSGR